MRGLPAGLALAVEDEPAEADLERLPWALEAFNEESWPGHQAWQPLGVFVRDGARMVAGLEGQTYGGWLFVRYLWVEAAHRRHGLGSRMLRAAEARAVERGAHSAWLDTFSFQAPGFYAKHGYVEFARLPYPPHERIFLKKALAPTG